jgi:hypothetical protein
MVALNHQVEHNIIAALLHQEGLADVHGSFYAAELASGRGGFKTSMEVQAAEILRMIELILPDEDELEEAA